MARRKNNKSLQRPFLRMPDAARRNFIVCGKVGYKLPGVDSLRPVKLENRWYFNH